MKSEQEVGHMLDALTWTILTTEDELLKKLTPDGDVIGILEEGLVRLALNNIKLAALAISWSLGRSCPEQSEFNDRLATVLAKYNNRHNPPKKRRRKKR